ILEAVVEAVEVPVTLKIRTGWSPEERNAPRIARIAEESGIRMLTVHGRTRACKFAGEAEYHTIRQIKQQVAIPVVANGDIDSEKKAAQVLKFTGADAIMIGRAARGRPWIFRQIGHYLKTGRRLAPPRAEEIGLVLLEHLEAMYGLYGKEHGVRIARKHIAWYSREMPGGAGFRERINRVATTDEQKRLSEEFFLRGDTRGQAA
ncbi:MAG TPA: tRNA dihydrouridine synthase DusB, partial [Chromatiaceae bacterium]|nr:tRNA dihydrouridine synthase DusB [Chromatiaceae bacterium]